MLLPVTAVMSTVWSFDLQRMGLKADDAWIICQQSRCWVLPRCG